MKRFLSITRAVMLMMVLVLTGCTTSPPVPSLAPVPKPAPASSTAPATSPAPAPKPSPAKTWQIRVAHEHAATSPFHVYGHQPWADDIEKATNGRVKVTIYPLQSLMKGSDSWVGIQSGIADMAHVFTGYYPGAFDLLDCIGLPFIAPNAEVASRAAWALYQKYPEVQAQMKAAKVLTIWATEPYFFLTNKKQIKTMDDFKGLKMRMTDGPPTDMMKYLGGVPMTSSMNDVYLNLQKEVIDGLAASAEDILDYRLYEVAKYYTYVPTVTTWFFSVMNWDTWNSFTPDIQQAFWSTCGERQSIRYGGEVFDRARTVLKETIKKAGYEMVEYNPPKAEVGKWVEVSGKRVWDDWVKKMEAKGVKNARQMVEDYLSLVDKYSKERTKTPVSKTMPLQ